ncbi:3-ketoacyl-ACP reductase [Paraburkholderia caffeinilytica]|uniref:3-ketoacyl-ACP reductase n=1 Tax=Paraburkholderia caffeinilytica TaxID=1761016 RepID=A0ABQ1LN71_9BURK|nr:SDR family NAD(P)-dependent oxidoreductase [Paraburkholderia caffeinilytica]AXL53667.1 3-ketoacyl-ACP reductase [Paraburkholderia caffeinilytica]GGC27107.1 3-ketoacyl-ACP reductase [Paraburkholderia caffeinilytica]CAB3780065.1 3-oxoacyl-[acyl-carrier-protein] reductase FabG [Paraburkholderia caffeinilytica]
MQLTGKTIAVTGAAQGIGRAIALALASEGVSVALIDVNRDELEQTAAQCEAEGGKVRTYLANVADESDVDRVMQQVGIDYARFDGLVNNAGIVRDSMLVRVKDGEVVARMSMQQWQAVLDVNLTGTFLCARAAAEQMVRFGNGGVIVNMSSLARDGNVGQSNYSAAKAGVVALTTVWARELARYRIRVGAIAPGFTATDILSQMRREMLDKLLAPVPLKRLGAVHEIAAAARFIFENDFFTGRCIDVDGGMRF